MKADWQRNLHGSLDADKAGEVRRILGAYPNVRAKYKFNDALTEIQGSLHDIVSVRNSLEKLVEPLSNDARNVGLPAGEAGRTEVDCTSAQPPPRRPDETAAAAAATTVPSSIETDAKRVDTGVDPRDPALHIHSDTLNIDEHIWFYIEKKLAGKLRNFQIERNRRQVKLTSNLKQELSDMVELIIGLFNEACSRDVVSWPIVLNFDVDLTYIERQLMQEDAILYQQAPQSSASNKTKQSDFSHLVIGPRLNMCRVLMILIEHTARTPPRASVQQPYEQKALGITSWLPPWSSGSAKRVDGYSECYQFRTSTDINVHIGQGIYFKPLNSVFLMID